MKDLIHKTLLTIRNDGFTELAHKGKKYLEKRIPVSKNRKKRISKDVLFIDGCGKVLLHPSRYRVSHQMEQLKMNNMSCDSVYIDDVILELAYQYRIFVIFRCPYNERLGAFVECVHHLNKKVFYDVDDLVIDTVYTDQVAYLNTFSKDEKILYDENVNHMGKMLKMCDGAITSTECLYEELLKYVPEVFINRNTASEQMAELSSNIANHVQEKGWVKIGYFSGSITHNDDFEFLLPVLNYLLDKYENLQLYLVGELDIPKAIARFGDRVIFHAFVNWTKLPALIASVDINIVPLCDTIFNRAKSENKWIEASLVKIPTVASDVGAFAQMIRHEETGFLCATDEDWIKCLSELIESPQLRRKIGKQAYNFCMKRCTTIYTGNPLKVFLHNRATQSVGFVIPGLSISGGIRVILKHLSILKKAGIEVSLIMEEVSDIYYEFDGIKIPIYCQAKLNRFFDKLVATMWTTVRFVEKYGNVNERYYLVQGFETDLYEVGNKFRILANRTYSPKNNMKLVTISKWCQSWLTEKYSQRAQYAPNGIEEEFIRPVERKFDGKIRILIEGDCGVYYKNVDESFKITNMLDSEKYEIWYMSYNASPKEWYHVDKFFHEVHYKDVCTVYQQCHILLKTSLLESFSYPPLEMMATGGYVIALPNAGNQEYLKDGFNCMFYEAGNILQAVEMIQRLTSDSELRSKLYVGGLQTAEKRKWNVIEKDIMNLYI